MVPFEITDADRAFAHTLFLAFSVKPGSHHIASERALQYLSACLNVLKPANVLELGAGIGTVTETLLLHPCRVKRVVAVEMNEFCLLNIRQNLTNPTDPRLTVVSTAEELAALKFKADLVIGDGGFYSREEVDCAKEGTVVFVEGDRKRLRTLFINALKPKHLKLKFREFGASREYRWGIARFVRFPFPTIRRISQKGCWIGRVKADS